MTFPSANYTVTYYKLANSPQLLARKFPSKDDNSAPMTQAELLAEAWRLANEKARESEWVA